MKLSAEEKARNKHLWREHEIEKERINKKREKAFLSVLLFLCALSILYFFVWYE